jgi:transcriptional regulator NrdR family protein
MNCPICGKKTKVVDSREKLGRVRRRHVCLGNKYHRFTTVELLEDDIKDMLKGHITMNDVIEVLVNHRKELEEKMIKDAVYNRFLKGGRDE